MSGRRRSGIQLFDVSSLYNQSMSADCQFSFSSLGLSSAFAQGQRLVAGVRRGFSVARLKEKFAPEAADGATDHRFARKRVADVHQ